MATLKELKEDIKNLHGCMICGASTDHFTGQKWECDKYECARCENKGFFAQANSPDEYDITTCDCVYGMRIKDEAEQHELDVIRGK